VLARPGIAAPISSATSVTQVKELIAATKLSLSPEHLALLG
jgi:aryl-alcohol dehydrogenase-like predicted oxidoreductase